MENKIKRFLSLALALLMVFSMMPQISIGAKAAGTRTIYLNAGGNSLWDQAGAWFAAWTWGGSSADSWVTFTESEESGIYEVSIPDDRTGMKVLRMASGASAPSWTQGDSGYWNQTGDLTISSSKNLITITGWTESSYTWGTYTYVAPTYSVVGSASWMGSWIPASGIDMSDSDGDGTYTVEVKDVAAGSYEFKVVKNHSWDNSWGKDGGTDNVALTVTEDGSTVTFSFNFSTKAVSATVTAPAEDVTYTVTFETNGGSEISSQTLYAGDTVNEPSTPPTKDGYTFAGWYTDEALTNAYDFSQVVTADMTLYAKWTENASTEPTEGGDEDETDTITVYFRNDWNWTDVSVYSWNDSGYTVAWPGTAMTIDGTDSGYDVYTAEIPADVTGIIFNGTKDDGSGATDQTPDITTNIADGTAWYIHWDGENKASTFDYTPASGGEEEEPGEDVSYAATFHFMNTLNWGTVNLYTWIGSGTQLTGSWPGSAVKADASGYYTTTVEFEAAEGTALNFIFNNGSTQTVDLALPASAFTKNAEGVYTAEKYVALTTQDSGKYNAAIVDKPEAIVTSPIVAGSSVTFNYGDNSATSVAVAGSFNSWSTTETPMTKNSEGVWTATVTDLAAGSYEYKFVVDGETWILDPMNGNIVTETSGNQNSAFYILSGADTDDDNKITVKIHYTRTDGNYENWNLWVWGSAMGGHQVDFTGTDENGAMVATIVLEDARAHTDISFKERLSVEGNEWKDQGDSDRTIDLSTVVSGTIDYYIPSGVCVYGDDVVRKNKVTSVDLNYDTGVVTFTTAAQVADPETEITLVKVTDEGEEEIEIQASGVGLTCTVSLTGEDAAWDLTTLYQYKVKYQGFNYDISIDAVYASERFAEEYTYEGSDLGATYSAASTTFKVWAPTATAVSVNLYTSGTAGTNDLEQSVAMTGGTKDDYGVWTATVSGDLNGKYYTYAVTVDGEEAEAVDPYARAAGVNGNRGMVIDLDSTDPTDWEHDTNPNKVDSQTDAIIYELHVRDFSIDENSGMTNKGKYLAFTEEGTTVNDAGEIKTGIDYLDELGVTHVHLLPVYDYGSVDETTCSNFNWGYDPVNYNVPEGSYSTDPYDGNVRITEFKQMVQSLHNHDISVIMDVVYNHVYNADKFCFNNIVPGYFSRVDSNTSGCGNDTASEREMVRKYIVESVLYWHQEYHIDGFRFDLVGLLDVETINEIVKEVHACCPDVIFYGEGWDMDGTNKEAGTEMAKQGNASKTSSFAYFSDSMRNGIGGNNGNSTGFASGAGNGASMVSEWLAKPWWTTNPTQVVQYASCHDNYTLVDKIIESTGKSKIDSTVIKMNNLAAAFYMTSQGIPFIHAGEEMLREKLNADGSRNENSYNSSDSVNSIKWVKLEEDDYAATSAYYQGLIEFRKAHPALRYATATKVSENVQTVTSSANLIVMQVDGYGANDDDIYVIFNAGTSATTVNLPDGTWTININGESAGTESLGTASGSVSVDAISAMVLTKEDEGKDESVAAGPSEEKTIYFSNNKYWTSVYAYAWTGETYHLGAWPGTAMTYVETNDYGEDIYSVTLPASADGIEGVIFHNNSGTQTVNVVPGVDGTGYYCTDADAKGEFEVGTYTYRAPIVGGADDYYLHGWINSADYTGADYKFGEDGTVTVTFSADSYVYVTNGDGSETYMTDGYQGAVTSATLKDTAKHTLTADKWDKLLIPGGSEVVITMVKNDDNTITLSYKSNVDAVVDNSGVQDGVTLHCWNWSFAEIEANMADIAAQGYTAIQTSPVQVMKEDTVGSTVATHWWVYYQPVDFVINTDDGNALGTKTELASMIQTAHKYGIKVIVDVVTNHLGNETGNNLSSQIPEYLRKDEYWHDITTDITNWSNRFNMTQYCMSGLPDLNTANEDIQGYVLTFLKECVDIGVDGFRFDAAKSIETPSDDATFASEFWPTVVGGIQEYAGNDLYIYGEILDDPAIAISAYTQYMAVTDNGWGNHMRSLVAAGTAGLVSGFYKSAAASNLVIWAESHDTYADGTSSGVSEADINKTWALIAARADAMGLYLARPASTSQELGVASVTGWANAEVKAANKFHNAFVGESETIGNSGNLAYVVRGTTGIVMVNVAGTTAEVSLAVDMNNGTYTDQITGNIFTVADGKITGQIGSTGIAVVHNVAAAEIDGTRYETLSAAIADADEGDKIILLADVEEETVILGKDITLDLKGHTVDVESYVVVYQGNDIIDTVGGGLLKAPEGHILLQMNNAHLPIWDDTNKGYVFANCEEFNEKKDVADNSVTYIFLPKLEGSEYELIAKGIDVSGVTMKVEVSWTRSDGTLGSATFTYTDALMQAFYAGYNAETDTFGQAFNLNLTGTAGKTLSYRVYFLSTDTNVQHYCN